MAITNGYATVAQFAARYLKGTTVTAASSLETQLEQIIEGVCRAVDEETATQFYATSAGVVRYFQAEYPCKCRIDDLKTLVSIALDLDYDGTYETTLTSSDYLLNPANHLPYVEIEITPWSTTAGAFPVGHSRGVKVTGTWGNDQTWATNIVREAVLLQSHRIYERGGAAFGVIGGGEFGTNTTIPTLDPDVVEYLRPVSRRVWWG